MNLAGFGAMCRWRFSCLAWQQCVGNQLQNQKESATQPDAPSIASKERNPFKASAHQPSLSPLTSALSIQHTHSSWQPLCCHNQHHTSSALNVPFSKRMLIPTLNTEECSAEKETLIWHVFSGASCGVGEEQHTVVKRFRLWEEVRGYSDSVTVEMMSY